MRKLLGPEPQLGLILLLMTVPIVGVLILLMVTSGVGMATALMHPLDHPLLAANAVMYLLWFLMMFWRYIRRVPPPDEDGYIKRRG
jgi:hypothetical protein